MLSWHQYLLILSCLASIAGLAILLSEKQAEEELEATERILLLMSFTYWLVHGLAVALQKAISPEWEWEMVTLGIRLTATLSYLLTFACVVSLPLHQFAMRQRRQPE